MKWTYRIGGIALYQGIRVSSMPTLSREWVGRGSGGGGGGGLRRKWRFLRAREGRLFSSMRVGVDIKDMTKSSMSIRRRQLGF